MQSLIRFFFLLSTPSLEQKAFKCSSGKNTNVIQMKLMWVKVECSSPWNCWQWLHWLEWDGSSNITRRLRMNWTKSRLEAGDLHSLLPMRPPVLMLNPLIPVQGMVTWQPGPRPGMYAGRRLLSSVGALDPPCTLVSTNTAEHHCGGHHCWCSSSWNAEASPVDIAPFTRNSSDNNLKQAGLYFVTTVLFLPGAFLFHTGM